MNCIKVSTFYLWDGGTLVQDLFPSGSLDGWVPYDNGTTATNPSSGLLTVANTSDMPGVVKSGVVMNDSYTYSIDVNVEFSGSQDLVLEVGSGLTYNLDPGMNTIEVLAPPSGATDLSIHCASGSPQTSFGVKLFKLTEHISPSIDISYTVNHVVDYYPYGKVVREFVEGEKERYLTTQHERDEETGLDYRGARYYDHEVARFLSTDPWQDKYPAWSTYNYCLGNPIKFIDPNGKGPTDWFLSQKTGQLVYAKGKSELTQSDLDKVGSPYDVSDYKRVGNDDMFGSELPITLPGYDGTNSLDKNHLVVGTYATELLMNYVGFEKAEQVKMVEIQFLSGGPMGPGEDFTGNTCSQKQIDRKVDYVKEKDLHQMKDLRVTIATGTFTFNTITKAEYSYTKPYGWSMDNYSYFNFDNTRRTAKTVGGMTKTILDQIKDFKKK